MPPKPAAAAKSADDDAADHEKEFVEKELIISFLKTRLSRCGSSRSDRVSYQTQLHIAVGESMCIFSGSACSCVSYLCCTTYSDCS